jgi:hypothetical protein
LKKTFVISILLKNTGFFKVIQEIDRKKSKLQILISIQTFIKIDADGKFEHKIE